LPELVAADFKDAIASEPYLDVISLFEFQRLDDGRGQTDG
jgi:hypothetical protein